MRKKILFAAMDWGIGHATRSVPIINKLIAEGHEVTLASSGNAFLFWKEYFPQLKLIEKPAYDVSYSAKLPLTAGLIFQLPKILATIHREKKWLDRLISEVDFNEVYSDNCYGLYNHKVDCTIITHQLMIKCPRPFTFMEPFVHRKILSWLKKFDNILIPDFETEENLSGDLSHKYPLPPNAKFIGPQSRFAKNSLPLNEKQIGICALISGPEPHRTFFEYQCIEMINKSGRKGIIIRGLPGEVAVIKIERIEIYNHLHDHELIEKISIAEKIICRSGYSTIMDLYHLGIKAEFYPTPGQTEQEYLAQHYS